MSNKDNNENKENMENKEIKEDKENKEVKEVKETKEKSTNELINEIKQTHEIEKFIQDNSSEFVNDPLHVILNDVLKENNLKKSDVVARSGLNRIYGYQIFSGKRLPSRDKLIALCYGFQFDLDKTNTMLKNAGFAELYAKNKRDSIIIFAINSGKSVFATDELLFENGMSILTA